MLRNATSASRASITALRGAPQSQFVVGSRRWIQTNANLRSRGRNGAAAAVLMTAAALGSCAAYAGRRDIYNDAISDVEGGKGDHTLSPGVRVTDEEKLHSLVWGSNRSRVLSPTSKQHELIRTPAVANWLDGVALQDLQLHETYGACVDANGDVYQWGDGFHAGTIPPKGQGLPPKLTLKGKNIVQIQLTENKVYALSSSGHLYVFASRALDQVKAPGAPTPSSDSWWGTGWLWGEDQTIHFAQLTPNDPLNWREKFTSIAGGKDHLLALTSTGRTFAHPISKKANAYGQLGLTTFAVPDPAATIAGSPGAHLHVVLTPKSVNDPNWKASRSVRVTSDSEKLGGEDLAAIDDKRVGFCPFVYEIPVLRGVSVEQIAAGARTSFVRTPSGRVLGWGANEFGQLGLGDKVTLDTITIPTEVVLWKAVSRDLDTNCTDVTAAGDLAAFVVCRSNRTNVSYSELLMTGNGQYGGLGNNIHTTAQSNASHVKAVSGLQQFNDNTQHLESIKLSSVTISPTGHVLASLDSSADSNGVGGDDVYIWGRNFDGELGNGKKSSLATPLNISLEPAPQIGASFEGLPVNKGPVDPLREDRRLMLTERKAKEVRDLKGHVRKRVVKVRQSVTAGYGTSVVYWKIVV